MKNEFRGGEYRGEVFPHGPAVKPNGHYATTLDRLEAIQHGTVAGYDAGCHGSACPASMSCREVRARYMGDYSFRKQIDSGMTAEQIVAQQVAESELAKLAELEHRRVERAAFLATRPKKQRVGRARVSSGQDGRTREWSHGSLAGYRHHGCRTDEACPASPSCREVTRADQRARYLLKHPEAAGRAAERLETSERLVAPAYPHGTQEGYDGGCFTTACPASPTCTDVHVTALGIEPRPRVRGVGRAPVQGHGTNASYTRGCRCDDCREATREYHRAYMARRKVHPIPAEKHGTAYGYSLGCNDRQGCPAVPACVDVMLAEDAARRRLNGVAAAPELVDAGPVIEHIAKLREAGVAYLDIAARAKVGKTMIQSLIWGRYGGPRDGEIPKRVSRDRAERILAVQP